MKLIIGREGNQPFSIHDAGVSRKHANLDILEDGSVIIEDLASANGTYVNGQKIIKKQLQPTDEVRLGPSYVLNVVDVVRIMKATTTPAPSKNTASTAGKTELSSAEKKRIHTEFEKLAEVYEKYKRDNIQLKKKRTTTTITRMIPPAIMAVVTFVIPLFLEGEIAETCKLIFGGISIVLVCVIIIQTMRFLNKYPEKEQALKEEYQQNYICPNCRRFLGLEPYNNLKREGKCRYCKTEW